jgi:hypothetical protein
MSDALPLPPRPNLEQYKKLAKDFQHACKSSDSNAIRQWAAHCVETITRLQGVEITGAELDLQWSSDDEDRRRALAKARSDPRMMAALRGEERA